MEDFQENKGLRANYTRKSVERYSRDRLENLKQIVSRFQRNGKGKLYSITVDGELVIPKTNDPEQFDEYLDYLHPTTECIEVRTYYGTSPNCNLYKFYLREVPVFQSPQALQGVPQLGAVEVEEKIQQALSRQKMETEIMLLGREVQQKDAEIENLKKKLKNFKKLQAKLDEKQIDISELFTKGIELYGAFQAKKTGVETPIQGPPQTPPAEVVIEPQSSALDRHIEELKNTYTEDQLIDALHAGELFARYPELKDDFQRIIHQKINRNG